MVNFKAVIRFIRILTLLLKLLKLFGTFLNLPLSNLSTSDFKLANSLFLAKSDVSTPVAFLNLLLLRN